ncbi:LemA family protein [Halothiobacillus sp.]|jgi:LemA protein|uniref:LemA family protein n=1 Tax=Halothiobacillus sp. TaxID=1891311 RepID=UPI002625F212|nr:LemA family protein [Halothiobacillus sp.]MDD3575520.1 LemA family protein [Halothiobacillus sp.]MDD4965950.1 LemA family protein [Halothiobacillus sp.]MDY0147562.1 LemA family protein [Halothiobacillus sp.]
MGVTISVLLFLVAVIVIWAIIMYNGLVVLKHNVSQAWSNIDVLLKQRHDELPKLVETAKQYMKYEQETLEKVMRARSAVRSAQERGDMEALGMAEGQLRAGLMDFYAVAEAYPDLKANTSFQHLQQRITGLENMIADRREFYNASVNLNNVRIEQFPDVLIAQLFRFRPFKLLTFREDEIKDTDLKTLFNQ